MEKTIRSSLSVSKKRWEQIQLAPRAEVEVSRLRIASPAIKINADSEHHQPSP